MKETTQKIIYALGFFDGVHLGHQALLRSCREVAAESGCAPGAVTFRQHPLALISGAAPKLICSPEDRNALLRRYGAEKIVTLTFDEALRNMPWESFLQMLVQEHMAAGFVCGYDFRFGRAGAGDAAALRAFCKDNGLSCRVVPAQKVNGEEVSSTAVRLALQAGDFEKALSLLGHGYTLSGEVVRGRQLGRTLGIPTANLQLPECLIRPPKGVYAAKACLCGQPYFAVTNLGSRPTVDGHHLTVESWLLDFSGDLYGRELQLELVRFLRPEKKFDSLEQLQAEILKNAAEARKILEES